jgi:hypothetical protein
LEVRRWRPVSGSRIWLQRRPAGVDAKGDVADRDG